MKIFSWNDILTFLDTGRFDSLFEKGTGISIGSFDGLHFGHRKLLSELVNGCKEKNLVPGVISFSRPLPSIKHSSDYQGDVSSLNQRLKIFEELGISFAIIIDFDAEFASIQGADFLNILVNACNMKLIAEGIDFRFGYKGATDVSAIKYFAQSKMISTIFVNQIFYKLGTDEEERISSSYIRQMIKRGFFITVKELLNRSYSIDLSLINLSDYVEKDKIKLPVTEITQVIPSVGKYSAKLENESCTEQIQLEIIDDYLIFPFIKGNWNSLSF